MKSQNPINTQVVPVDNVMAVYREDNGELFAEPVLFILVTLWPIDEENNRPYVSFNFSSLASISHEGGIVLSDNDFPCDSKNFVCLTRLSENQWKKIDIEEFKKHNPAADV